MIRLQDNEPDDARITSTRSVLTPYGEQDENEGVHRARDRNPKSAAAPATGRFPRGADFGLL